MIRESENSSVGGKSGLWVFVLFCFVEICYYCNVRGVRNFGIIIEVLKWIFVYIFFYIRYFNSDYLKLWRWIFLVYWLVYICIYSKNLVNIIFKIIL